MSDFLPVGRAADDLVENQHDGWTDLGATRSSVEVSIPGQSAVIIQLGRNLDVDVTLEWLLAVMPTDDGGAGQQLRQASLVVVTDPAARLMKVLKADVEAGDHLVVYTASIG